jgi:creatinine amidohydrolase/Fe(II)-dependent formamide hydrolase-like protein
MPMLNYPNGGWGHATREETETLMPFHPDSVDLSQLPPKGQPIENVRWAVVDDASFRGRAKKPVVCREEDPRLASARRGKQVFGRTLDQLTELLRRELS